MTAPASYSDERMHGWTRPELEEHVRTERRGVCATYVCEGR